MQGSAVRAQLVAALDDWASATADHRRRAWLLEVARRAEPGDWGDRFRDPAVWEKQAALEQLARKATVAELSPQLLTALGRALQRTGADPVPLLTAAQERHPTDFWLNFHLGDALFDAKREEEAVGYYRAALAVRPGTSTVYNNLGNALARKGRLDDAIRAYRRAIALDPNHAKAHTNLGAALAGKGRLDDAIREYQKAIALDPNHAGAHTDLGAALRGKGRLDDAIREHHKAIVLDPRYAPAHTNLGAALAGKGRLDDAIREYQKAIALDPKDAKAHSNLGAVLRAKGRLDEAIKEYHQALALAPRYAKAHYNLGLAFRAKDQPDHAIKEFRKAIALDPRLAEPHGALGQALLKQGRFAEAQAAMRRCLELLPPNDPDRGFATEQLRMCERLLALSDQLPPLLQGEAQPTNAADGMALAQWCQQYKQLYAAAVRFYAAAFTDQPQLAADLRAGHRYDAACAAALAAVGRDHDADPLGGPERARLRQQALGWLRADLAAWAKLLDTGKSDTRAAVQQTLRHWQWDPDLAGLRDAAALARLPADERQACQKLWADAEALLQKAQGKTR
jgi:tetratricopeptide (TPR) repeat protein